MFTIIYRLRRLMTRIPGYPTGDDRNSPRPTRSGLLTRQAIHLAAS